MKFKLDNANRFSWDGLEGWVYNSAEDFANANALYAEVTKSHGKIKTTKSDLVYFIIEGKGVFTIEDEEIEVESSDVIIVPKNTSYDYRAIEGTLKLFLVHTPSFDPDSIVRYSK